MEKTKERLRQTVVILRKLTQELGLPYDAAEVQAIKDQMSLFVRNGEPWKGVLSLAPWEREAILEMKEDKIELTLRAYRR